MKHAALLFCFLMAGHLIVSGQDPVFNRIILIGDAGEINYRQSEVLKDAASRVIAGKTSVVFLGDNVYPNGVGLSDNRVPEYAENILRSQYLPMKKMGASVYFIPGNHDWDKSGPAGLAKIKRQWQWLNELGDSAVTMVPANGCPDPSEIMIGDSLVMIVFDSEWWLYPLDKTNPDGNCECKTKKDVLAKFEALRYKNRHKIILLASHHPFQSYGVHGGKFSWKDHLFPLTAVNKKLYIPLPVIGSLYPFLRNTFSNPEDLNHPLYRNLVRSVSDVFEGFPNIVYVAGHEHGLQLIKDKRLQVVSGAGAKSTAVKAGKKALFTASTPGYVVVDLVQGNTLKFAFYDCTNDTVKQSFSYTMQYTPVKAISLNNNAATKADSLEVKVHPLYNRPGKMRRLFFGENYRKEWASSVKLPVIKISSINGGLMPIQLGGGFQSKSLRLADSSGKEWVIRSVEKVPDALIPEGLGETFAKDWLDDVTSAQHPFAALIVPTIANAVQVPHANPILGVLSPDSMLGIYGRVFENQVVLLEEREPLGKADNSAKMIAALQKDNGNRLDAGGFLQARMLDALLGDWDRHEDQWRWYNDGDKFNKNYRGVPRDRDQVFHVTQGLLPKIASLEYVLPTLRDFDTDLSHEKWLLFKSGFINAYPSSQFSREEFQLFSEKFKTTVTDSVLETALLKLPKPAYDLRYDLLLRNLQLRRDKLPVAMDKYYQFIQKVVDIRLSDKSELVKVTDAPGGALMISVSRLDKKGILKEELMNKVYSAAMTKEVRIYLGDGNDSVFVHNEKSTIKLRIIGGNDRKAYHVIEAKRKVLLYDKINASGYGGDTNRLKKRISNDEANTSFAPVNLYNIWMPLLSIGSNADDGLIMGAGFKLTRQEGFRKFPYASTHQLLVGHSFSTQAYSASYVGVWLNAIGKADLLLQTLVKAPNNSINFFGRGNETHFDKTGDFKTYYRARFSTYELNPALRWRGAKKASFSLGPSLSYYQFDIKGNAGRLILYPREIGSYDSLTIEKSKLHLGIVGNYVKDNRSSKILPQWGTYFSLKLIAYKGIGQYARNFAQIIPTVALFKSLNQKSGIVLAERLGGTIGIGKTAFYQSTFVGGHENLLGYRQYRFAGQHSIYNNLELRIKLADVASYVAPGQFGMIGFWDVARVWEKGKAFQHWKNGVGGGLYFAPASRVVFSFIMGKSSEGWYPYFTMGMRF